MDKTYLKAKKIIAVAIVLVGLILVFVGFFTNIPGTKLTTISSLDDYEGYSSIEEYVGGDAYNYIIGASLVGGEIAGATAAKAIYIGIGFLMISIGLVFGVSAFKPESTTALRTQQVPRIQQTTQVNQTPQIKQETQTKQTSELKQATESEETEKQSPT